MATIRARNDRAIAEFTRANLTESTRRAYSSDLTHFKTNGGKVPATVTMVSRYLAQCAGEYAVSTLKRRLMAIRQAHVARSLPSPTDDPSIKALLRGIQRKNLCAQRQARPILQCDLRKICRRFTKSPLDLRDKALLLLGFAGAFRRSELVAVNVGDLERTDEGFLIQLRRSKTDQEGWGRTIAIPKVRGSLCAVAALERWLKEAEIDESSAPIFQRLSRAGKPNGCRLHAAYVSLVLKSRLAATGVNATDYSAHSLRAGLVTEASKAGVPPWKIQQQTGHKTEAMVSRYIRDADLFRGNAAAAACRPSRRKSE
jgi:integrase